MEASMSTKLKVTVAVIALATSFAVGRFLCPAKIETKTVTVEVEKKTKDIDKDKQTHSTTVETRKPDGTVETTTTTDTNTHVDTKVTNDTSKSTETDKTVTYSKQSLTVMGMYGIPLTGGAPVYGGSVTKQVLGPVAIGLFGLSSGVAGAQLGLAF